MSDYLAIDCGRHSQLELHIMHKDPLIIDWEDENQQSHQERVIPTDILSIKGDAEYLVIKDSNEYSRQIRLDRILSFKINNDY